MAAAVISDGATISTLQVTYLRRKWMKRHEAQLAYDEWGQQEPIPLGNGSTIRWHQFLNLSTGTVQSEGTVRSASAFSTRKVSATLTVWEDLRSYSKEVGERSSLDVAGELLAAMGYSGALTKDEAISEAIGFGSAMSTGVTGAASAFTPSVFSQGFPLFYAESDTVAWPSENGGVVEAMANATVGKLSTFPVIGHIRKVATHLENMDAIKFEDGSFRGIIHPTVAAAIRTDSLWPTWNAYSNRKGALTKGLLGEIEGVMFKTSSKAFKKTIQASAWAVSQLSAGGTLFGTLVFGMGAYGVTKLAGKDVTITHLEPGKKDKSDPLGQIGVAGYSFPLAAKVLNPSAGVIWGYYKSN